MGTRIIFYVHHLQDLLQSEFMVLDGVCSLYYFVQGILVDVEIPSNVGKEDRAAHLPNDIQAKIENCPYELVDKTSNETSTTQHSKYIQKSPLYTHPQDAKKQHFSEEYEILEEESFIPFKIFFTVKKEKHGTTSIPWLYCFQI